MLRSRILILVLFTSTFFSCQDVIDIDVPEGDPLMVVDGWISDLPGPTRVRLSKTIDYFSNSPNPAVSNAVVILINTNGSLDTMSETSIGSGVYESPLNGTVGNSYYLYIKTSDGSEYQSNIEELVSVPVIDSIYYEYREETIFEDEGYYVQINTKEPVGLGDHYRWKFYKNDTLYNKPEDLYYADDEFVDGNDINGFDVHNDPLEIGDTARVEQLSISKHAYDFIAIVQEQTAFVGSIFDFPASPIQGNIYTINEPNEGVLGFFGASSVATAEIVIQ